VPIQRFRTFDEARRALWLPAADPALLLRMKRLGELGPERRMPHGVVRFRTIEEAKARRGR
jgi:hypothetical protein